MLQNLSSTLLLGWIRTLTESMQMAIPLKCITWGVEQSCNTVCVPDHLPECCPAALYSIGRHGACLISTEWGEHPELWTQDGQRAERVEYHSRALSWLRKQDKVFERDGL